MTSKKYRMDEFMPPEGRPGLLIDTSAGLSLGSLRGLGDLRESLQRVVGHADGMVISPGQVSFLESRSRTQSAILLRADWTNALRDEDFVLPPEKITRINLLTPSEALDMGATAVVVSFLLGYDEQIEAGCLKTTVQSSLDGNKIGMPVIVDVLPTGPRVVMPQKAVELGVSYALEGGADGIAIPWPGAVSFETIFRMAAGVPVWVKIGFDGEELPTLEEALKSGAAGAWLDHSLFAIESMEEILLSLDTILGEPQ